MAHEASSHQSPVVEIVTGVHKKVVSPASGGLKALQVISGSEAYRKYDWLRKAPVLNASNNLRGMVVSKNWRIVFEQVSHGAEVIGKVAVITAFAAHIADQYHKVEDVLHSHEPAGLKGLRLTAIAGTAAQRTLAGMVTGVVSAGLLSMQGYCQMVGLAGAQTFSNDCVQFLKKADGSIQTTVKSWTDTTTQAEAIYWVTSRITFR